MWNFVYRELLQKTSINRNQTSSLYSEQKFDYFVLWSLIVAKFSIEKTKFVDIFQGKMAYKYTCILLLVSVVFLLAQAKDAKKGNTKQQGKYETFRLKTFIWPSVYNCGQFAWCLYIWEL